MSRQTQEFSQTLTAAMTAQGVSSALLARRLQITERTVARWRAGDTEPIWPVKQSIGLALGLGAEWAPPEEVAA